ncbi:MAG: hypothetical protein V1754_03460 [Pseudomonadota bacterium]
MVVFSYVAYGLGIQSEVQLPELIEGQAPTELTIRRGKVLNPPDVADGEFWGIRCDDDRVILFSKQVGAFEIRNGQEIVIDPIPGLPDELLRFYLLTQPIVSVLHQRGFLLLHASAVSIDGKAAVFVGRKRCGKSTIAALLCERGHDLLCDDIAAVLCESPIPMLVPGFPQLKLWPDTVVSLGETPEEFHRLHPGFEKRARPVFQKFSYEAVPIGCIYVLEQGDGQKIGVLNSRETCMMLVRHSRALHQVARTREEPRHLFKFADLSERVLARKLVSPHSLKDLPSFVDFIERDFLCQQDL